MKILAISATFPYPPTRGGTPVRTFNLLKHLARSHEITLVTQPTADATKTDTDALRETIGELALFPPPVRGKDRNAIVRIARTVGRFGRFAIEGTPPNVTHYYLDEMQAYIDNAVNSGEYDAIACEHSVNELFVRPQWQQHLKTVVDVHSSAYATCRAQLQTGTAEKPLRDRLNLPLLYRYERRYCSKFSTLVVTTADDGEQMHALAPNKPIAVVPNGVDLDRFEPRTADPQTQNLVFVGTMDYISNINAARFFALNVLPALQQRYPDASFTIVGAKPVPAVTELATRQGVKVTGRVPSVVEYLHGAAACVVPMEVGFGIKNKTLEAMAAGVPVVASDRGLEGLAVDGEGVPLRALRANRVEEYVEAIARLFDNPQLRQELSHNGRSLVETQYTWERAGRLYEEVFAS
jgi:glycosyltransferase involved in cell wall biosynthesis